MVCRPAKPALVFDIGAGTGRDAAWLAAKGHEVVAIEPSNAMRRRGQQLHPSDHIRWLDDRLPSLATTLRLGLAADFILVSGVWQHLPPADRPRAFRKLVTLLKPGGLLAITLRHGPAEPERGMHDVSPEEIERLARAHGLAVVRSSSAPDIMGRAGVRWTQLALRLPDGVPPSRILDLRGIRTRCRDAADGSARRGEVGRSRSAGASAVQRDTNRRIAAIELNPENVWQYPGQNWLSNTVFENYDAILDAACAAWRNPVAQPETITSIRMRD